MERQKLIMENVVSPKFNASRYLWLRGLLPTNLLDVDEELARVGVLVQDANENSAIASELFDAAKEKLKVVYATCAAKSRLELTSTGKTKTEAQVDAEAITSVEYQKQQLELSDARLDAGLWASMVAGVSTKSYSLKGIAELISSGFITREYVQDKSRAQIRQAGPKA